MVTQCVGGEDEAYPCPYHTERCGPGWIPFGMNASRCVQIAFLPPMENHYNPFDQARYCGSRFGAIDWQVDGAWVQPATLTSRTDREFVAAIVARAGFDEV
jgi:hypothetical protein